ncbi:MAG: hypothetical protein HKO85_08715 [Xanthomonadales bacterium]|nr:hypothetical protein [Xanthomonadales bacterium]
MPGTQPTEIGNLESPNKCDNCHGGYNTAVEPAHNWRGSMMAHAGRDPIFWATVAVAEQDFDGAGDLCIRCHSTGGWLAGRSTPTDGSGLAASDSDGVECDYCHKLTNPDDSEHPGNQFGVFAANGSGEGFYGSGMSSMWGGSDKLGPYNDAEARHQFMQSLFHRDRDFCGTCHDVSNPVTGDLAHNHGQALLQDPVVTAGTPGGPVEGKAAFNNPPYAYGIVERTFSEYKAGMISETLVDDYPGQPDDFPSGGVLEAVYQAATDGGARSANYQNPSADRYFSCQTCHMRPVTGTGANKRGVPVRTDLPLHDMTGGNYWMPAVIDYLNQRGLLRLGGGMSAELVSAMYDGGSRALEQLQLAASLEVGDENGGVEVKVTNHTGHKLISGYPEGRRMWLNVKWYDSAENLLREDGKYGDLAVVHKGENITVRTLLNPETTRVYEAHMGMTQQWASQLRSLGYAADLALEYDRETGAVLHTLGELASGGLGPHHETFHFVLNNIVTSDNRIPPYRMRHAIAKQRNALPVPESQFDLAENGGVFYDHYDEVDFTPPPGATHADVNLMYQPTSWEYIQFLALANDGGNAFLGAEGDVMFDAWRNAALPDANSSVMAEPVVMAAANWGAAPPSCEAVPPVLDLAVGGDKEVTLAWSALADSAVTAYGIYYDQSGKSQWVADSGCLSGECSFIDSGLTNGQEYCYMLTAQTAECESAFSNIACATPQPPGQQQAAGVSSLETGKWVRQGKGKHATTEWVLTDQFVQGDQVIFRGRITDENGNALQGASFQLAISGPESASLVSGVSDAEGYAEASWSTAKPNKKGVGGTATGSYTAAVSGASATGYGWDGVATQLGFTIASP